MTCNIRVSRQRKEVSAPFLEKVQLMMVRCGEFGKNMEQLLVSHLA